MARVMVAAASRSPRYLGKITPRETAPAWWPPRPMRWSPLATDGGASIWMTRSIAPMSMPSSSDEVATMAGRRPALRSSSTCEALLPAERAVVGAHELLARELVEGGGHALGQAAAVHEHERGAVGADQLEQAGMDGGPDGRMRSGRRRRPFDDPVVAGRRSRLGMSSTGTSTVRSSALRDPASTISTGLGRHVRAPASPPPRYRATSSRGRCVATQPDALGRSPRDLLEPLQRQGEVGAALAPHHGVDLVHDHDLDRSEHRPRLRR
jgi:hypothetical protein